MTGVLACPGFQRCPDSVLGQLFRCAAVRLSDPVPTPFKGSDRWDSWTALNKHFCGCGQDPKRWCPDGFRETSLAASKHARSRLVGGQRMGGRS